MPIILVQEYQYIAIGYCCLIFIFFSLQHCADVVFLVL